MKRVMNNACIAKMPGLVCFVVQLYGAESCKVDVDTGDILEPLQGGSGFLSSWPMLDSRINSYDKAYL